MCSARYSFNFEPASCMQSPTGAEEAAQECARGEREE